MFHFEPDPVPSLLRRPWLVGCGAMGGALLSRWIESGLPAASVTVVDPDSRGLPAGFAGPVADDPGQAMAMSGAPTIVVLGIKPQMLAQAGPAIATASGDAPILSMLAGVRIATLKSAFPAAAVVRMMPNTPARIGRGMTALYADGAEAGVRAAVEWMAEAAGRWLWLEDEDQFDAVTGLSGSGPAYLFRFIEALADAGEAVGLPEGIAKTLALQTVAGAAELAARSDLSPAKLRDQVTSPNGTTAAGLQRLDGDGLLSSLMRSTVRAATERSRQLAAAADGAQAQAPVAPKPQQGLLL